jgi:D-aminopeptidase
MRTSVLLRKLIGDMRFNRRGVLAVWLCTAAVAFAQEAQALVPGIEAVGVKQGLKRGAAEDLDAEQYAYATASARHLHPQRARRLIRLCERNYFVYRTG